MFNIGTQMAGALNLNATLTVPPASSIVLGHGTLGQATNPPLHINSLFNGMVHTLGLGKAQQIFALQGTAPDPKLLGAPHVTQLLIALDGPWANKGTATYSYIIGSEMREVRDVPVNVEWIAK
jgi:Domain of unknown function (DUF1842).